MKAFLKWFFTYITAFFFIFYFFQSASGLESTPPEGLKVDQSQKDAPAPEVHIHDLMPQMVVIDSMANLYEPVEFDHEMHAAELGCTSCHHHIIEHTDQTCTIHNVVDQANSRHCTKCHQGWYPGSLDRAKCRDCHSSERYTADYLARMEKDKDETYHRDNIGLVGAYHNQCLPCHVEEGIGGCQDCHARTEAGDKEFQAGAGVSDVKKKSSEDGH